MISVLSEAVLAVTLVFGDRKAYVDGFDGLVPARPPLSMAMEFARGEAWMDWKGARHSLRQEWAYVHGPAQRRERCAPGTRDDANDGVTLDEFEERARAHVAARREAGYGLALPESAAFLSRDEVVAVRLYSGPSFTAINSYLRRVAGCGGADRLALAAQPQHTFAATCRHLASAVRKLAAVATPEEAAAPLWRGVRGELECSFWRRDAQGDVCVVDTAFMSTSRQRETPIAQMDARGPNVLWELQPRGKGDTTHHHGADISVLSQFAAEAEVIFPPCTMMVVCEGQQGVCSERAVQSPEWREDCGCRFLPIGVSVFA